MPIAEPDTSQSIRTAPPWSASPWLAVALLIAALTAMRLVYAGVLDLRTDEAYYWTWSKESALAFLDHPPGYRLADPVRHRDLRRHESWRAIRRHRRDAGDAIAARRHRPARDARCARRHPRGAFAGSGAVLRAVDGEGRARHRGDPLCGCDAVVAGAAARERQSALVARRGLFAGLAMLSKFTAIMLLPAVAASRWCRTGGGAGCSALGRGWRR